MHMLIYALVEASSEVEAVDKGKSVFEGLVGPKRDPSAVFDYFVTFDEKDSDVAGEARYGKLPAAAPVESESGQDMVERARKGTQNEIEEKNGTSKVVVYDQNGTGIQDRTQLNQLLDESEGLWIVPADVHY